jgi:flagellar hook-length control protein FliK
MNIEGVNLLPPLSGNGRVEAGVQPLLENGAIPEGFANALMGQIGLLSEANGQAELPGQLQDMAMPQNMDNLHETVGLLKQKGDGEEFVALFEKYLPIADKKNEAVGLNQNVGPEATLRTFCASQKYATPSIAPAEAATAQGMGRALTGALKFATPDISLSEEVTVQGISPALTALTGVPKAITPDFAPAEVATAQGMSLAPDDTVATQDMGITLIGEPKPTAPSLAPDEAVVAQGGMSEAPDDEAATAQDMGIALADALQPDMLSVAPDEAVVAQDMIGMALNSQTFVRPLPGEAKLNVSVEDAVLGGVRQKETALRQTIQNGQGFNLQALENAGAAEKTLAPEKQASLLGLEKAASAVTTDMLPIHRPVDNRADSPAITKPLTHPGWSKDLGEQILWMNNKEMPAAELRLNPAHLGPISVRIDVNQDQATILFTALHAEVKEAIEASIPKLREMLLTQQINLVSVNISQNSTPDQGRPQPQAFSKTPGNGEQGSNGAAGATEKIEPDQIVVGKGLLNLYA